MMETEKTALYYLSEIKQWLTAPGHENELIVLWFSRHGSTCLKGEAQYPGTTPAIRQAFWKQVTDTLGPLLLHASNFPPNTTTLGTLHAKPGSGRVLIYTSDWAQFTGSDPAALDACAHIDNVSYGSIVHTKQMVFNQMDAYATMAAKRQAAKRTNTLILVSLATSSPDFQVEDAAKLTYDPFHHDEVITDCAAGFNLPNVTQWCPRVLLDISQTAGYYASIALEAAHNRPDYAFPTAFYVDAVTVAGGIRTGTTPLSETPDPSDPHATTEYAYVATVIDWLRIWHCSNTPSIAVVCNKTGQALSAIRAASPYTSWQDLSNARLQDWPLLPQNNI